MGMHVSQLRSVPVGAFEWYVYVVDASRGGQHTDLMNRAFSMFAQESGPDAVIVTGPRDLSAELYRFLTEHAGEHFARLEFLLRSATCLVVSRGALQTTRGQIYVLPLASETAADEAASPTDSDVDDRSGFAFSVLRSLIAAMADDRVEAFMLELHSVAIPLSQIRDGLLITTLRNANRVLELKPNIWGVGLNLNGLIERVLSPESRQLPSE